MNNTAQSVDVVKDCFGMTEVRRNKSFSGNSYNQSSTVDESSMDEEFHW